MTMAGIPESVKLLRSQYEVLVTHRDADVVCLSGGWGNGKTECLGWGSLVEASTYPGNYIAVVAATYPQLRRSTIRKTRELFNAQGVAYRYHKQEKKITLLQNGSEIEFLSCAVPPEEMQGPEFGALFIDEAEGVSEDHFKALVSRVRKPDASRRIRIFCNPPHRRHWVFRLFKKDPQPGWKLVQGTTYENGYLPESYIRRLEAIYGYRPGRPNSKQPTAWRRYMNGEMGLPVAGAVYPEFNDHEHVISLAEWEAIEAGENLVAGYCCGFDFGAGHPTAFVLFALLHTDILIQVNEHRESHMGIDEHLEHIHEFYIDGAPVWSDHQLQERIEYELKGMHTLPAPKHIGVEQGIEAVRRRLVMGQYKLVRENCPKTYDEFQTYKWAKPKRDDVEYRDRPIKLNDDLMDADRYCITGLDQAMDGLGDDEDRAALSALFAESM